MVGDADDEAPIGPEGGADADSSGDIVQYGQHNRFVQPGALQW